MSVDKFFENFIRFLVAVALIPFLLCLLMQAVLALITALIPVLLSLVLMAALGCAVYFGCHRQNCQKPLVLGILALILVGGALALYRMMPLLVEGVPWLVGLMGISIVGFGISLIRAERHKAEPRLHGTERAPFVPQDFGKE